MKFKKGGVMSAQDMPDWYINIMAAVGLEMEQAPVQHKNLEYWFQRMWEELSKPENVAKIPAVARLIEACKPEGREVPNTILVEGFTVFSLNKEKINEALKPFKGGD